MTGSMLGAPSDGMQLRALGGRHDQPDVPPGKHQHGRLPVASRAVDGDELSVQDREELLVAAVHVVGDPAPVTLQGEGQHALYAIAIRFNNDLFLTVLHGRAI